MTWVLGGLNAVWAFIRSPLGKYVMAAVAILGLLGGVWVSGDHHGHRIEKARQERALKAAQARVVVIERKADAITQKVAQKTEARVVQIRTVTRTIIERIPEHVTPQMDRSVAVPVGFVRVFNASAAGLPEVPAPAGQPDDAAAGIALSTVAQVTADDFGACHEDQARLSGLQEWVRAQAKLR